MDTAFSYQLLICAALMALYFYLRREKPSDRTALENYAKSKNLTIVSIEKRSDPWPYWLKGKGISNVARIFVLTAQPEIGPKKELHIAIDSWGFSEKFLVLVEKDIS